MRFLSGCMGAKSDGVICQICQIPQKDCVRWAWRNQKKAVSLQPENKKESNMNSKLLKLNEPYNVIYAAGKIGRHIATLLTWCDDPRGKGEVVDAHQYPVIDQGEEFPAGTLVEEAEIEDCRVVCSYNPKNGITGTNIFWLSGIIQYDFQQLEPSGAEYILERLKLLDCKVMLAEEDLKDENGQTVKDENGKPERVTKYDYSGNLYISLTKGDFAKDPSEREYIVKSPAHQALYFESSGTADEIFSDLSYQLSVYKHYLLEGIGDVKFHSEDMMLADVLNRLNANQGIETHYKDML